MKLLQKALSFFFVFLSQAQAQSIALPGGITVDPPPALELTLQVVPSYDPEEKVLAAWEGEQLLYFITVGKLPPGWLNADQYLQGFVGELRAAGKNVETAKSGKYKGASTLSGQFLNIRFTSTSQTTGVSQALHFLTDGKVSFVAFATLVDERAEDRMLEESKSIFESATLSTGVSAEPARKTSETPYVGSWHWSGTAPNGAPASAVIVFKDDLSFSTEMKSQGVVVFHAVGVWAVSGRQLFWSYLRSQPPLPADKKEDEDEIVSLDGDRLVLRSKLSGKEREFVRK